MDLLVLGSSGSAPVAANPGSGYLVSEGSSRVLLDAGPGVAMALLAVADPADLDAIFLSHRHADHCSDIFALYHHLAYGPAPLTSPIPVFAPEGLAEAAGAFAGPDGSWAQVFDWRPATDQVELGALVLSFGEASHSVPAACLRIEAGDGALVYTGDTGPGTNVAALAARAHTLLSEATYQDATDDDYPFHLSARQAGELAASAGVHRLVLTHLRSTLDPEVSLAEAAAAFDGEVLLAEPGMRIEI